jgi:tetratricopeptide (TPR) repeat protein
MSDPEPVGRLGRPRTGTDLALGVWLGASLVLLAFVTNAGGDLAPATWAEIALILLGAGICGSVVWFGSPGRAWGAGTIALFAALAAFTALSILWSVKPDDSWLVADQTLSYLAAFVAAAGLARIAPERWPTLIVAVAVAAVALSGWALLVRVFPGSLDAGDQYGRLQQPFGYWNATGLIAALGLPACLWGACHRDRGAKRAALAIRALGVPAITVLITVVVLCFSRSALLTAVVGLAIWFVFVPLRLRAVLMLALGGAGALVLIAWALATPGFSHDNVAAVARTSAGHTFGLIALGTLAVLTAAGAAAQLAMDRAEPDPLLLHRIGTALVVAVALIPVGGLAAAAASSRGLTGEISHAWTALTSPSSQPGNNAARLTQLGNSRSIYWREGLTVGEHALLDGVGAMGFKTAQTQYRNDRLYVEEAHSYVIQTFADLGLIGIAISLALLIAWLRAVMATLSTETEWRSLTADQSAERCGLLTLVCVAVMFGVQSATDWTWYIPGVTIPPLLCAGWLVGRGPLQSRAGPTAQRPRLSQRPGTGALLTALSAVALLAAWATWQPLRSADALSAAGSATDLPTALSDARSAAALNPLSPEPLFVLSALDSARHDETGALTQLRRAVNLQPDYDQTWFELGDYELANHRPREALVPLTRSLALNRGSAATLHDLAQARSELAPSAQG